MVWMDSALFRSAFWEMLFMMLDFVRVMVMGYASWGNFGYLCVFLGILRATLL